MLFENCRVMNFENAIIGMRNSYNSWDKADSRFGLSDMDEFEFIVDDFISKIDPAWENLPDYEKAGLLEWYYNNSILYYENELFEYALLGKKDLELMQKLANTSSPHRKFMRQIFVSVDITCSLQLWKQLDTYQTGVTKNSTSTMHTLVKSPITLDNFDLTNFDKKILNELENRDSYFSITEDYINFLENLRLKYIETKDNKFKLELLRWLPQSFLQKRTVTMNYENVFSICCQRDGHFLPEWKDFIAWAKKLPYAKELLFPYLPEDDY